MSRRINTCEFSSSVSKTCPVDHRCQLLPIPSTISLNRRCLLLTIRHLRYDEPHEQDILFLVLEAVVLYNTICTAQHIASSKVKVTARRALPALNPVLMRARHSMKYHVSAETQLVNITTKLATSHRRDFSCRYFSIVCIVMNAPGTLVYPCKNPLAWIGRVRHTGLQGGEVPLPPIVRSWPELLSMPSPHFQKVAIDEIPNSTSCSGLFLPFTPKHVRFLYINWQDNHISFQVTQR